MDTVLLHRLIDAVRDSLDRAGRHGYALQRAESHDLWLDLGWLGDYFDSAEHERLPLMWEGRALAAHETLKVPTRSSDRTLGRIDRTGEIILCADALVAPLTLFLADGLTEKVLIVGERSPGALQRLVRDFGVYAHRRSREWPWITVIGGDPVPRPRGLDWSSLVLPAALRDDLRRQVSSFFELRAAYERMGIPHRRGLLFTGPPGNGKTSVLRQIASDRAEPFFMFTVEDYPRRGEIDEAFDKAALAAPSILCFEDVDSLFRDTEGLSHFLNRLDGLHPLEGVLILATTNHPEKLDAALTERPSRFDRIFHFANPAAEERRRYLRDGLGAAFDEVLVTRTEGCSMAQLKEVRVSACLEAIQAGRAGPTLEAALQSIRRMAGQKDIADQEWEPGRTIAGFQWSKPREDRNATTNRDTTSAEE